MSDYTELVKALRCMELRLSCNECEYGVWSESGEAWGCEFERKNDDAAAAIEELETKVTELKRVNLEIFEDLPKRGEWTEENRRPRSMQFVCSVCHRTCYDPQPSRDPKWVKRCRYAYCPNCGAKMEVQE